MALAPVMVIGGSGFLGSHVCRELAEKSIDVVSFDVQAPDFHLPKSPAGSLSSVVGDILDLNSLSVCVRNLAVGAIIHTVAFGNETAARKDPHTAITLNVQGTLNVLEAARQNKITRLVYISTAGVYGKRNDETPIREDEAITWRGTIYHPSHYMGEVLVEMYREVYGMETVILRPLSLYGPALSTDRDQHLKTKSLFLGGWVKKALNGEVTEVNNADTRTDLTYVEDAANLVCMAYLKPSLQHSVFNVSSGTLVSYREIAQAIQKNLPGARFEFNPGAQDNPLRPTRGPLDLSRAKEEFDFLPKFDLSRGMQEFIDWCKAA